MSGKAVLGLALVAACADASDPAARSRPIINGTFDVGDEAVVALTDSTGEPFCTGTVVSPHVVVAAGHCVLFGPPEYVFVGSDPRAGGMYLDPRSAQAHPDFDFDSLTADLSVVVLADRAPVAPIPISTRAPLVGEDARFVGFGYTEVGPGGDYGRKYQVTSAITTVDATVFGYGVATCNGDSGGPAFVVDQGREVLAGVTSWGDPSCGEYGYDTRVDVYGDWVRSLIAAEDPPSCDADGQCASDCIDVDPDCPCAMDGHCTPLCGDPSGDGDCPPECLDDGTCAPECPILDPDCPARELGDPCDRHWQCGEHVCHGVCVEACGGGDPATCPAGHDCVELEGGVQGCVPDGAGCGCGVGRVGRDGAGAWLLLSALVIARRRRKDAA